jgi:hypothetical protein
VLLPWHRFSSRWARKPICKALAGKYKLVRKNQPFVGDAQATFRQGDSSIELDAPHLSFSMTLSYMTNTLQKAFKQQSARD